MENTIDGFGYDLDKALKEGNIFERIFHHFRISPWLNRIDYNEKKVLDIGCNTGILLIPLLEKGVDIVGVDISKSDIKKTKKKLKEKNLSPNKALVADAVNLPFRKNSFDIALLSDIIEHVAQPELVAKEAYRVVKPEGYIIATAPNQWHPVVKFNWLRKALSGRDNTEEHSDIPYSFEKLIDLFPKAEVVEKSFAGFLVQIFCKFKKT